MGQIIVATSGSFGKNNKTFSAQENGHADAVARAIEFLASEMLPDSTALDHKLHSAGNKPHNGFNRARTYICGKTCHPGDENCNGYCEGKSDSPRDLLD